MEKDQKLKIAKRCIEMIPDHGSISIRHVCGDTELNISPNERIFENYRSIAGLITLKYKDKYLNEVEFDVTGKPVDYNISVKPKSWKERYWVAATIINISIGLAIGFFFRIITEPKHNRESNQQESAQLSPTSLDTLHKNK